MSHCRFQSYRLFILFIEHVNMSLFCLVYNQCILVDIITLSPFCNVPFASTARFKRPSINYVK